MKIALLHDWLTGFRGGERMLEAFCELFPDADLYTLIYAPGSTSKIIESRKIKTSFLNRIPGITKSYRKFLPLFPLATELLKLEEDYDLVISSSHCTIKGVKIPKGAVHICYLHSPMRYIYDQFPVYFGKNAPLYQRLGATLCRPFLQVWDKDSNKQVDQFVANSYFVQKRIDQYYRLPSEVIHPFVDLDDFPESLLQVEKEDFYLMVTAFAPNKRVDMAIRAFNQLGLPLKIVGSGQQEEWLKSISNENIEFLGNLSRESVVKLYSRSKGLIFPGIEDFGITPLESLAAGTPVIAYGLGGVLETLTSQTAQFFTEQTSSSLVNAVKVFETRKFDKEVLRKRSCGFSKSAYKKNFLSLISIKLKEKGKSL